MDRTAFIPLLCIWVVAIAFLLHRAWRQPSSGLVLAYCFQLWMLHWLGGLIHALPWADLPDSEIVLVGFQQSTYGIVAFALGTILFGTPLNRWIIARRSLAMQGPDTTLPRAYVVLGIVSYFAVAPTIGRIPGLNFVSAVGSQLAVVGCCLACWQAWHTRGKAALLRTIVPTIIFPVVTVLVQGFLGYGIIAISIVMFFCAQFFRPRWLLVAGFLIAGYVGLSFYTSYMRERVELRASLTDGGTLAERWAIISQMISRIEAFTPKDPDDLALVDIRLNQNTFVGAAVGHLSRPGDYARGATLWDAALGLIPRLIWPSKPVSAGSGNLVSRYTGMTFAEGTSIGIGPVLEFYANFGTLGVVLGFLLLGGIIKALDLAAGACLITGNWRPFTTFFLVGISFLNVSGSLVEVSMGAMGSLVMAGAVNYFLKPGKSSLPGKQLRPVGTVAE
jgi:hypothetical protein